MLRLSLLAVPAVVMALFAAGGGSGAPAPPNLDPFEGEWTAVAGSAGVLKGRTFTIRPATEAQARGAVSAFYLGPTGYFTKYCGAGTNVYDYLLLTYTWNGGGTMGGCISKKTAPHIVYLGNNYDAGNARIKRKNGLGVIEGTWDLPGHIYKLVAEHATVSFSVVEQGHKVLKGKGGAKFELSKAIGRGAVALLENSGRLPESRDATGTLRFHKWKVFQHGVIDEDDLVLKFDSDGTSEYLEFGEHGEALRAVPVAVTKADPMETDRCAVGARGKVSVVDTGKDHEDILRIVIPGCHVDEEFENGTKSSKVAANVTYETP